MFNNDFRNCNCRKNNKGKIHAYYYLAGKVVYFNKTINKSLRPCDLLHIINLVCRLTFYILKLLDNYTRQLPKLQFYRSFVLIFTEGLLVPN